MTKGPVTVAIAPYLVDAASKTATAAMRACSTFDETYTLAAVEKGKTALPDFITLSGSNLIVTPLDHTDVGTWVITVTQTTAKGIDPVWDAVTITVGCQITAVNAAAAPTTGLTYTLYSTPLLIDLKTWAWTQVPSCGFTFSSAYSWTIPTAA